MGRIPTLLEYEQDRVQPYVRPQRNSSISRIALQPGEMFFRYQIVKRLGRGGMGEVYEAFDTRLRRAVALKILTSVGDASHAELRQLLIEARALAALRYNNIVTVYDVSEHAGLPYLAMELLKGRSLVQIIKAGDGTPSERVRWLVDIARALATVHRAGLVHRDVKPGNVILTDDGRVVLFDLGIARQVDPTGNTFDGQSARGGMVLGTPRYMAPELVTGTRAGAATDQYAWGVVAAQLLTGQVPAPGDDVARMLAAARVPRDLAAVVIRAVDACTELRFGDMNEVVATLESVVTKRRSFAVALTVLVASLSLVVGAVGGAYLARKTPSFRHDDPAMVQRPVAPITGITSTPLVPLSADTGSVMATAEAESARPSVVHQLVATHPAAPECAVDDDCACGVSKATGICAVGSRARIDTTRQCPDYCEGFQGNMSTTCKGGRCIKAPHY